MAANAASETRNPCADAQDEQQWQAEFSDSMDVISALADKALADHGAGRTKKITDSI